MPQTLVLRERYIRPETSLLRRAAAMVRSYVVGKMSLKDPALAKLFGAGYQTAAGIPVTDQNAFTFSAVYDAVNQSSGDLAKLPLNLLKKAPGGGSVHFDNSKTYKLLKYAANPDMTAFEFRRTLQAHALTLKGGFAEIERDGAGRPAALWPMTPDRVDPFLEETKLPNGNYRSRLRYRIDGDSKNIIESADMIHIRGLGYDGYGAYPVIDRARQAIGIALAAERFAGAFFGNNANLGGVLASTDADLDEPQAKDLQERVEKLHKGPDRAWKMLVLGAGFKYYRTGVTPSESQMDDMRNRQVDEVARFFNMPVHKLKNMERATFNNIEQMSLEYYTGHQLTWITNWEQELNRKLVPGLEIGQQYFKHNANAVLRADIKTRYDAYAVMLDRGVFCADDVLELEDMNPQPNGQGKIYLVQGAMVPKDKVSAMADATIENKKAPKTPAPAPAVDPNADPNADRQRELESAQQRALEAEAIAAAARATAQQEREARIVAETAGTSTTEQLAAALERERQAAAHATELTALSVQLRADVDAERIRLEQAREAQATAEATVVTTAAQLVVAREAEAHASRTATELTTLADQLRAEVEAERQRAAAAETARAEAIDHRRLRKRHCPPLCRPYVMLTPVAMRRLFERQTQTPPRRPPGPSLKSWNVPPANCARW
jgi:HK97 family phage portal protein